MFLRWLSSILGGSLEKRLAPMQEIVTLINALETKSQALKDEEFPEQTRKLKQELAAGKTLEDILPEAFALVREASKRALNMRHFDVQLLGGLALHQGKIAEMKTGEGKTLVATLAVYLNALSGHGVHLVTVNDYLAKRDAAWMGKAYNFLGLTVGCIYAQMQPEQKRAAYLCDITYGTNNEFGFDYLRDNMAVHRDHCVQRELHYAIVDEVDSILIDEARTPLIISGMAEGTVDKYKTVMQAARRLEKDKHFTQDEKAKNVSLTEDGIALAEKLLGVDAIYDIAHMDLAHMVVQSLRALHLFRRDVDYVIKDEEILIVDEFTGRLMVGRRYSEGLHQAIEAKENVEIQEESQTLATITLQNYFRMYKKLAGMTGTAVTEEAEFLKIYKLEVLEIPTHMPMVRKDRSDVIYKSNEDKFKAVIQEIKECYTRGQPVLVGTISIENSEKLSGMLVRTGVPHNVLNAKNHALEAEIVAKAGQHKAVTIATNMAGRGTDIVLGAGVKEVGGLHIIGTERHESRRIDNQLRGRAGRQGDPGSSRFYVALDDELMRLFGGSRIASLMDRMGLPPDTPIEHGLITRSIERAQNKVEQYHFSIRKQVLEYDDVMNRQRRAIYALRRQILEGTDLKVKLQEMLQRAVERFLQPYTEVLLTPNNEALQEFAKQAKELFLVPNAADIVTGKKKLEDIQAALLEMVRTAYAEKENTAGEQLQREIERVVLLRVIDTHWIDHLHNMDVLRDGIGLRAYGQRDPLIEYKIEAYKMYESLLAEVEDETITMLFKAQVVSEEQVGVLNRPAKGVTYSDPEQVLSGSRRLAPRGQTATETVQPIVREQPKVGRNDPCPCGSGKKYKKCCGSNQ